MHPEKILLRGFPYTLVRMAIDVQCWQCGDDVPCGVEVYREDNSPVDPAFLCVACKDFAKRDITLPRSER